MWREDSGVDGLRKKKKKKKRGEVEKRREVWKRRVRE